MDAGANAECRPEMLAQFGVMGSVYMERLKGVKNPRVGLINIGAEESKSGFTPESIFAALEKIAEYPNVRVKGLMAIPPISEKDGDNRKFFEKMCNISVDINAKKYDNVTMQILSMGMSHDYAEAILSGANMVRVGTAIFGERHY